MHSDTVPACADRILHMSDLCAETMPAVREWADNAGLTKKLDAALDYCRTFSKGPEKDWHSHLHLDMGFDHTRPSFICNVSRRVEPRPYADDYAAREGLQRYMLIGMIWDEREKDWSFHS